MPPSRRHGPRTDGPLPGAASRLAFGHRAAILTSIGLLAVALGLGTIELETRFDPRDLVGGAEPGAGPFADGGEPVLVLIESDDVLESSVLGYLHRLARQLQSRPEVARVDGLTTTPLPTVGRDDAGVTLEALEQRPSELAPDPEVEQALITLAASAPRRFPRGLASIGERTGGELALRPLVHGDAVTPEEARAVREQVQRSALVRGRLVSADRDLALVAARLNEDLGDEATRAIVHDVEAWLARHPPPEGVRARLAGQPYVRAWMARTLEAEQAWLLALSALGSALMLALGFRRPLSVLLPLAAVGAAVAMVLGAMGWLGVPLGLLGHILPALLVTIGIGDAVHLLARYREQRRAGLGAERAARRTFRAMALACLVTSVTTAAAFASLAWTSTPALRRFGLLAAGGVMVAYAVVVVALPLAASALDRGDRHRTVGTGGRRLERWLARIAVRVLRWRWTAIALGAALLIACAAAGARVRPGGALLSPVEPSSAPGATAALLEREMQGFRTFDVILKGEPGELTSPEGLQQLARLERWLQRQDAVIDVTSHASWLREAWALLAGDRGDREDALQNDGRVAALMTLLEHGGGSTLRRYVGEDGARARLQVRIEDRPAGEVVALADRTREQLATLDGASGEVTGPAVRVSAALERTVHELAAGFGLALLVIFVALALLLRSVRLSLVALPPNLLALGLVLAYMTLRGLPLDASTAIVFSISLGLAVDDTVHLLVRFRFERARASRRSAAVVRAVARSGQAVVLTSLVLLVGFGVLATSSLVPIQRFAELSAVAIGAALLADLVLLPALLCVVPLGHPATRRSR